jgi:hypothetical protein
MEFPGVGTGMFLAASREVSAANREVSGTSREIRENTCTCLSPPLATEYPT